MCVEKSRERLRAIVERDREIVINSDSSGLSAVRSVDVGKFAEPRKIFGVVFFLLYCFLILVIVCLLICDLCDTISFFRQQLVSEP